MPKMANMCAKIAEVVIFGTTLDILDPYRHFSGIITSLLPIDFIFSQELAPEISQM